MSKKNIKIIILKNLSNKNTFTPKMFNFFSSKSNDQKPDLSKVPMTHDLNDFFKLYQNEHFLDITRKDIDLLEPHEHGIAIQLYFIKEFRRSINLYINRCINEQTH
jgi:hypothetical protein